MMCIATLSLRRLAEALNNAVFSSPYRSIKIKQGKNTKGKDQLKVSQSNEMQDYKTYYCSLSYFIVVIFVYYMKWSALQGFPPPRKTSEKLQQCHMFVMSAADTSLTGFSDMNKWQCILFVTHKWSLRLLVSKVLF